MLSYLLELLTCVRHSFGFAISSPIGCEVLVDAFLTVLLQPDNVPVLIVAAAIILGSLIAGWRLFRRIGRLTGHIRDLAKVLGKTGAPGQSSKLPDTLQKLQTTARAADGLSIELLLTERRLIVWPVPRAESGDSSSLRHAFLSSPSEIWNGRRLLSRRVNLGLLDAMPNLLLGIGLAFTFFFLALAITKATAALGLDQNSILGATQGLLQSAGAKFLTSLAGLFCSLMWTFAQRRAMHRLEEACEQFVEVLMSRAESWGYEQLLATQVFETIRATDQQARQHAEIVEQLKQSATQDYLEEMLGEMREQTKTLKNFDTTLALAIKNAMGPQLDAMGNRLSADIKALSEKLNAINQDALERMLKDFAEALKAITKSELTSLANSVAILAERLERAGINIEGGAGKLGEGLDAAGERLAIRIQEIAQALSSGGSSMHEAAKRLSEALNELDVTVHQVEKLGREGGDALEGHIDQLRQLTDGQVALLRDYAEGVRQLKFAGDEQQGRTRALQELAGQLKDVSALFERTASQLSLTTRHAVQDMSDRITVALRTLDAGLEKIQGRQERVSEQLDGSSDALAKVLQQLQAEIPQYSASVTELHKVLGAQMATIAAQLQETVEGVGAVVEELAEARRSN